MSNQIADLILLALKIFTYALIGRALISWVDPAARWPISRILHDVTEPFVAPIRQVVPRTGVLDLSFIVAFVVLWLLQRLLFQAFYG
jgi:YggT family protein